MFRKIMGSLAIAALCAPAACVISGPSDPTGVAKPPCIDDFRAVAIQSPSESQRLVAGEVVVITWEMQHVCSAYTAEVEISYDGGLSFTSLGHQANSVSRSWHVPALDGAQPVIRVRATDLLGELTDDLAMESRIQVRAPQPNRRPPHDRD